MIAACERDWVAERPRPSLVRAVFTTTIVPISREIPVCSLIFYEKSSAVAKKVATVATGIVPAVIASPAFALVRSYRLPALPPQLTLHLCIHHFAHHAAQNNAGHLPWVCHSRPRVPLVLCIRQLGRRCFSPPPTGKCLLGIAAA